MYVVGEYVEVRGRTENCVVTLSAAKCKIPIVAQTLGHLQLSLLLKYTLEQEASTCLHNLNKKQLLLICNLDSC